MRVGIIDTGACNLNSVYQALRRTEAAICVSHRSSELTACDRLILPGVGSAQAVMAGIEQYGLRELIVTTRQMVLGICLGMQIQAAASREVPQGYAHEHIACLGILPGCVQRFPDTELILPHMGWNQVHFQAHPLFQGLRQDSFFYFVHSYYLPLSAQTIATCTYGVTFSACTQQDNFLGVQFHPEKSGPAGQRLLENFLHI